MSICLEMEEENAENKGTQEQNWKSFQKQEYKLHTGSDKSTKGLWWQKMWRTAGLSCQIIREKSSGRPRFEIIMFQTEVGI